MPKQREYVPAVGEEVLVLNHLGSFMVEEVDAELKTASLRALRSGVPMTRPGVSSRKSPPEDQSMARSFARSFTCANSNDCQPLTLGNYDTKLPSGHHTTSTTSSEVRLKTISTRISAG